MANSKAKLFESDPSELEVGTNLEEDEPPFVVLLFPFPLLDDSNNELLVKREWESAKKEAKVELWGLIKEFGFALKISDWLAVPAGPLPPGLEEEEVEEEEIEDEEAAAAAAAAAKITGKFWSPKGIRRGKAGWEPVKEAGKSDVESPAAVRAAVPLKDTPVLDWPSIMEGSVVALSL